MQSDVDEAREALLLRGAQSKRVDALIAAVRAERPTFDELMAARAIGRTEGRDDAEAKLRALREAADALVRHYDGEDCNGDCETVDALRAALAATPAEPLTEDQLERWRTGMDDAATRR